MEETVMLDAEQMEKLKAKITRHIGSEDYNKTVSPTAHTAYAWARVFSPFTEDFTEHSCITKGDFMEAMIQLGVKSYISPAYKSPRYPISRSCQRRISLDSRAIRRERGERVRNEKNTLYGKVI